MCVFAAVVPFFGEENWKQVQCGDSEETVYEQDQQAPALSIPSRSSHEGQGTVDYLFISVLFVIKHYF